jgi:hypothetical protein
MFAGKAETYPSGAFNGYSLNMYDLNLSKILDEEQSVDSYRGANVHVRNRNDGEKVLEFRPNCILEKKLFCYRQKAF